MFKQSLNTVDPKVNRISFKFSLQWPEFEIPKHLFDYVINTTYETLSSGVPWNIPQGTCIFSVCARILLTREGIAQLFSTMP